MGNAKELQEWLPCAQREIFYETEPSGAAKPGPYIDRQKAAYWDGKNSKGEIVASGLYFYQIQADDLSNMKKMVVVH